MRNAFNHDVSGLIYPSTVFQQIDVEDTTDNGGMSLRLYGLTEVSHYLDLPLPSIDHSIRTGWTQCTHACS